MSDFFLDNTGMSPNFGNWKRRAVGALLDPWIEVSLTVQGIRSLDRMIKPRRVLAVGIEVPSRQADIHTVLNRLRQTSRHWVQTVAVPMAEGFGKFANVERALSAVNLKHFDWLLIADDDISFGNRMVDRLIKFSELAELSISQPAHKRSSIATYSLTLRKWCSFVRETHFVEIGPLTAIRSDVFSDVIPFPPSRWCYGIDVIWSELARKRGFKMGIVDAATVRHLRPVASSYNIRAACAEGEKLIRSLQIPRTRKEILGFERVLLPTQPKSPISNKIAQSGGDLIN